MLPERVQPGAFLKLQGLDHEILYFPESLHQHWSRRAIEVRVIDQFQLVDDHRGDLFRLHYRDLTFNLRGVQ